MSKGYITLVEKVKRDCNEGQGCFNENGCDHEFYRRVPTEGAMKKYSDTACKHVSKCGHKYCDKFKWIIDRAKHYGEKTGLKWEDILDSWEEQCNYWYMNFYQDCNQPEIKGEKVKVFDTVEDMLKAVVERQFRCPACGGISTDPYKCNTGLEMSKGKICDWNVNGLFKDLGKGVFVYCKDKIAGQTIFMPISWEK